MQVSSGTSTQLKFHNPLILEEVASVQTLGDDFNIIDNKGKY